MNRLNLLLAQFTSPRLLWLLLLVTMLIFALAAGAPDGGICPGTGGC
jgi:hypothetical protein